MPSWSIIGHKWGLFIGGKMWGLLTNHSSRNLCRSLQLETPGWRHSSSICSRSWEKREKEPRASLKLEVWGGATTTLSEGKKSYTRPSTVGKRIGTSCAFSAISASRPMPLAKWIVWPWSRHSRMSLGVQGEKAKKESISRVGWELDEESVSLVGRELDKGLVPREGQEDSQFSQSTCHPCLVNDD